VKSLIEKLANGNTLITLGEGTVFVGNVHADKDEKPFGIYFSNEKGTSTSKEAIIMQIHNTAGVASYLMAMVRFLEATAEPDMKQLLESIELLKRDLEPLLPKEKK
jgi:hypothetical protein